jgi:hypothetical protein
MMASAAPILSQGIFAVWRIESNQGSPHHSSVKCVGAIDSKATVTPLTCQVATIYDCSYVEGKIPE